MQQNKTTNNNSNNNNNNQNHHRRQWSEGLISTEKSNLIYKDDDRQLIQHLVNEYLLEGSNEILDLIRNSPNEYFEALVDFIWNPTSQTVNSNDDDLLIYNQRSSLISSLSTNVHRQNARRRLSIIMIEIFKLLSIPTMYAGRFDLQRQNRLLFYPSFASQLISYEPDICGLSCLACASMILINPLVIHHQIIHVIDILKQAANHFVKMNLSFENPSIFALSIYSLFYLLYILYPNNLRRELALPESMNSNEKPMNRSGIEQVLLPLCCHFKFHPNLIRGNVESEKQDNRWQQEQWQQLIANGDRYVVSDDISTILSNDFRKRKEEKSIIDSNRFDIKQIIDMCNEYAESVLHPSEMKSQIVQNTIEKHYEKKHSMDCSSNYSNSHCQTYEQQWQTIIQNGQINLSRIQTSDDSNRRQEHSTTTTIKKDSTTIDHNIPSKVQFQLDMLDCNYEQDKREYYAQLIRDLKKTLSISELERDLKNQENQYQELINIREQKCLQIHDVRKRINDFHELNEAFYNSLSSTQIPLKTDGIDDWQQQNLLNEKQIKLKHQFEELQKMKTSIECEIRDIQRHLFQMKKHAEQSIESHDLIEKLSIDYICARKKHQLLHNALVNIKLKSIDIEKLFNMYEEDKEINNESFLTIDEKKMKFQQLKQLLIEQHNDLKNKRNNFNQNRKMNTHKINAIRRQIDSIRICQTQLNTNSQIIDN